MHETHLINDSDLFETNLKAVCMMKYLNPKDLLPWESELFYQTIAWCRHHLNDIDKTNISIKQKVAIRLYLIKLFPLVIKQKNIRYYLPLEHLLTTIKGHQKNSNSLNYFNLTQTFIVSKIPD